MVSRLKIPKGIKISAATAFAAFVLAACSGAAPAATPVPAAPPAPPASAPVAPPVVDSMGPTTEAATSPDSMANGTDPKDSASMTGSGDPVGEDVMDQSASTLVLDFSGLNRLANGFHYEGWAIIDGSPVSTGKFNVDADGNLVALTGKVIVNAEFDVARDLSDAMAIALTIEPPGDTDSTPSDVKYLAGDVAQRSAPSADLTVSHGAALGDDFTGAEGTFILATPTNGADTNETSGIWYIDLSSGGPTPGLQLPPLPPSFEYEGWVIIDGTPVSTGKFRDVAAADSGNPFSGPEPGKPFPGEDFLRNAPNGLTFPTDIRGRTAAISIEPVPDDSPAPFALKPLVGGIPADGEAFTNYQLGNQAGAFPTGSAVIR